MELQFHKTALSCLDRTVRENQNSEQTQEIKLPDSMPDIGRVIAAWGQGIQRGKEWRGDSVLLSCGMLVWVLYAPEDGSEARCLDAWIPFQLRWELPQDTPEGTFRAHCSPRFVDARSVSPRKILVRAGMSAMAEVCSPKKVELYSPQETPDGVQMLQSTYPVRLWKEAGEKTFQLEETLSLPPSAPVPEQLIYSRVEPRITDKKVLGNKVVFRGSGNLHALYRSEEGQLHGWDFELPFSQYAQLDGEHSTDAQADVLLSPTGLELTMDEEGQLHFSCGLVGQYLISDQQQLSLVEDAYSPGKQLQLHTQPLELPVVLERRRENLYGEQTLPAEANITADVSVYPELPRQRRMGEEVEVEVPGMFQVLYYGEDGMLRSGTARWESTGRLAADENTQLIAFPTPSAPQAVAGSGQISLRTEIPTELTAVTRQQIPMATGMTLGESLAPDPNRPTLILRRVGEERLWDIAKESGTTLEAIRQANNLQNEPSPNQILLIPMGSSGSPA